MKNHSTKRALCLSVVSMLLCLSMLVGSTFAWFTDSVACGVNKIVAGNLDVELEYATAYDEATGAVTEWTPVDPAQSLFKPVEGAEGLWEPGHTEYVQLRIRNAGSLALKYSLDVRVYADEQGNPEQTYTSVVEDDWGEHKEFILSQYLVFSKTEGAENVANREQLWLTGEAETSAMGNVGALNMGGVLLPGDKVAEGSGDKSEEIFTLAVYMPTWVGNEANQLTSAKETEGEPTIYLGVNLVAAQTPYEADSFDDQYDAFAFIKAVEPNLTDTVTIDGVEFHVVYKDDANSKALLLAKDIQQMRVLDSTDPDWETSELRAYLNSAEAGGWLADKPILASAAVATQITSEASGTGGMITQTTTDKVFLLSYSDVFGAQGLFSETTTGSQLSVFSGADYAAANPDLVAAYNGAPTSWWLRSSRGIEEIVTEIGMAGTPVYRTQPRGVRPALWVDLP